MELRIYLSGGIVVEHNGIVLVRDADLRGRQTRLAFAYLIRERRRSVSRTEMAEVLWPEQAPVAADSGLNAIISRLRAAIRPIPVPHEHLRLDSAFGQVRLWLPAEVWVDLDAATLALEAAETALRAGDAKRAFGPATVASVIARRPFLADDDTAWAAAQRLKLRRKCQRALECLSRVWLACGEPELAVEAADEAVALDRHREPAQRLLMQAHAATGNRAEALIVYGRLRESLARDVGADPAPETESLYLELLA